VVQSVVLLCCIFLAAIFGVPIFSCPPWLYHNNGKEDLGPFTNNLELNLEKTVDKPRTYLGKTYDTAE